MSTLTTTCPDCNGSGFCHHPFGDENETMPCPCRDYEEMDPRRAAVAEMEQKATECIAAAERAAALGYTRGFDYEQGQAHAFRSAAAAIFCMRR